MIRKFSKIKNLAVFKDFDWKKEVGKNLFFETVNIIYGRNYSGKTTLSRMIRSFETGVLSDKYKNPQFMISIDDTSTLYETDYPNKGLLVRVFNEDFVNENLRFITNPESKIVPFAVLGEENTRLETEITELLKELGDSEVGHESGLYLEKVNQEKECKRTGNDYTTQKRNLDTALARKATDRTIGIKYHSDKFGNQNYNINNLNEDIKIVTSHEYDNPTENKLKQYEQLLEEKELPIIDKLPKTELRLAHLIEKTTEICSRKVGESGKIQELLLDAALNEWVHRGMELHKDRERCAFCGQMLSDKRWELLYKHFDTEFETLKIDIQNTIELIEEEKKSVDKSILKKDEIYSLFHDELDAINQQYKNECQTYERKLNELVHALEIKQQHIIDSMKFNFDRFSSEKLEGIIVLYNNLISKSNTYGKNLSKEKKSAQNVLRLAEVYNYLLEIDYDNQKDKLYEFEVKKQSSDELLKSITDRIDNKLNAIEERRRMQKDEVKGANKINEYLRDYFGCSYLCLQAKEHIDDGKKNFYFVVERNGEPAYHLSEGERSLIAFCYFIAKLDDVETAGKKPIIWIDDPISSLDGNHIYFIFSLLQTAIFNENNYTQLFITTHNLLFLKYICRMSKNAQTQYFLVERNGDISTLKKMPKYLKECGTEFNHWFKTIYLCAQKSSVTDDTISLFESFGNNTRKFFETYLYFRYPDTTKPQDKLKRFFGEDIIPPILLSKIYDEKSHAEGDLENHSIAFDEPEIISAAKCILKKLQDTDKDQFDALVKSVDNEG